MNRIEFMTKLEYLLQDLPEEEKTEALAYYRDYLEDAGEEHEEEAIREFGSPERVAAIIRSDLNGSLDAGGEFTEAGYQDERFRDPNLQVVKRKDLPEVQEAADGSADHGDTRKARDRRDGPRSRDFEDRTWLKRLLKVALLLVILGTIAPVVLGIGGGLAGLLAGGICLVIVAVIGIGALTIAACIGSVAVLVYGAGLLLVSPGAGVLVLGLGVAGLGLALLGIAVSLLVYGQFIPFCIRGLVNMISGLMHHGRRKQA